MRPAPSLSATFVTLMLAPSALSRDFTPAQKRVVLEAAQNRITKDGATVKQVLEFASKLRPREFKVGPFSISYDYQKNPVAVTACYWIGAKRLDGDAMCELGYRVSKDLKLSPPTPPSPGMEKLYLTLSLDLGRDAFIEAIDMVYYQTCIDAETHKKFC